MNVLLIGEESAGIQMLGAVLQSGHRLVAVMASPPGIPSATASLWKAAEKLGVQTWPGKLVKDPELAGRLRSEGVDIVLNVHSLYLIHKAVLAAPKIGAFNMHPGPLPRYAGLNAVSWAIYRGETSHGVTVHRMVPEIDAGPIVYQSTFPIEETDSALSIYAKCTREGIGLMLRLLEVAANDPAGIPSTAQNVEEREYFGKGVPEDGRISWCWPAERIVNFVRACDYFPFRSPWGSPRTLLGAGEIAILKAVRTRVPCLEAPGMVGELNTRGALVASADEWVLVQKLKIGRSAQKPQELLRSGDCLAQSQSSISTVQGTTLG
jgi:methionyl-tRNA formyltransferase